MSIWLGNQRLDGGSARNVGDIFYTTRTDTSLAGAVECNGGTYSTADYTGTGSIGELLSAGKLPYLSLAEYAQRITNTGNCAVFGWDGGTTFRVPTLRDIFIEATNSSSGEVNWYKAAGLPNITGSANFSYGTLWPTTFSGALYSNGDAGTRARGEGGSSPNSLIIDASRSSAIYGNSNTVQPEAVKYRAMVQLFNSTTDEAVATVGTVVAQVGENTTQIANRVIKGHEVIDFQIPTAGNGYTWYRKYADGWVEQGQNFVNLDSNGQWFTMPVEMTDGRYNIQCTSTSGVNKTSTSVGAYVSVYDSKNTTSFQCYAGDDASFNTCIFCWTVSGMAK